MNTVQHSSPSPALAAEDGELDRVAFNAAFHELGLRWHWDGSTYDRLAAQRCERARLRGYLEAEQPHLLRAYDAEFLSEAILRIKTRCRETLANCPPRALPRGPWLDARWAETGV